PFLFSDGFLNVLKKEEKMRIEKIEVNLKDKKLEITYEEKIEHEDIKTQTLNYNEREDLLAGLCILLRLEIDELYKLEKMKQIEKRFL
ncbi:MAG: hypothetical protein ABII25_02650, partial [bacterium]